MMKAAGYQPVPLETSDILPGFQTGLINAIFTLPFYALSTQLYAQASHMLELNWAPLVGGTVITRRCWDEITPAARDSLRAAAEEAGRQIRARGRTESGEAVEAMKARGLMVHPMTPPLEAEWRRAAEGFYPKIRGSIVPADFFDQVQKILAEIRAGGGAAKG